MEITHMGCGREAVRINPDGSTWIVPDITPVEAQRVLHDVALTAARLLKENIELKDQLEAIREQDLENDV